MIQYLHEEVTQEVFVRIWQKAHTFDRARGSALAWITTMTRRLAIDRTRSKHYKARTREVDLEAESGPLQQSASTARAAELVSGGVEAREVLEALDQLAVPYREVIRLSYFEGLSHAKIANHLDTPLGTVKSRLREAIMQLRRLLDVKA